MPSNALPARVYLVDDSVAIRSRVAAFLADDGMAIVGEAGTPAAAIDGILTEHPDVVVLDVQLEGGTGLDVLRAVREAGDAVRFVVFSNNAHAAYRKRYLGAGAAKFLDKSSEFGQLRQAVRDAAHAGPAH
jgi:two-component system response regulator DesR